MTLISPNSTHPRRLTCGPFPAARPGAGYRGGTGWTCGPVRRYRHTPTGPTVTQTLGRGGGRGQGRRAGARCAPVVLIGDPRRALMTVRLPWHGDRRACRGGAALAGRRGGGHGPCRER